MLIVIFDLLLASLGNMYTADCKRVKGCGCGGAGAGGGGLNCAFTFPRLCDDCESLIHNAEFPEKFGVAIALRHQERAEVS